MTEDDRPGARARRRWDLTRDVLLFTAGLVGFITVLAIPDLRSPTLLVLLAGMMGLPAFINADKRSNGR